MSGAAYFLDLAEANLSRGDRSAALSCLESAASRGSPAELGRLHEILDRLRQPELSDRVAELERQLDGGAPVPKPTQPKRSTPSGSLEAVRQLLVSPELVAQLKSVFSTTDPGTHTPLSLPVTDIVAQLLASDLDLDAIGPSILEMVVQATGARGGYLMLGEGGLSFGRKGGASRPPEASVGVLEEATRTRKIVAVQDARIDQRFATRDSVSELDLQAVLCVPVLAESGLEVVGLIYLEGPVGCFGASERELAETLAALVSQPLWNARRFADRERELARARVIGSRRAAETDSGLLGRSPAIRQLEGLIDRVAPSNETVLIQGESGTGKELVARAIHARSSRAKGPFVAENMGALSEGLLEAELFGHAKGAFTGADRARPGLFRVADGGTLLLDEVGEMSLDTQRKLLRVLQEREVRPVGSAGAEKVDVRVLAATHRDLREMIQAGEFRQDLYYRLSVLRVDIPPLRNRQVDIPLLLEHYVAKAAAAHHVAPPPLDDELTKMLIHYAWPGNVRELVTYATRFVLEGRGALLDGAVVASTPATGPVQVDVRIPSNQSLPLREARVEFDRVYIKLVLERCGGKVKDAATALGLNRTYLSEVITRLGLRDRKSP